MALVTYVRIHLKRLLIPRRLIATLCPSSTVTLTSVAADSIEVGESESVAPNGPEGILNEVARWRDVDVVIDAGTNTVEFEAGNGVDRGSQRLHCDLSDDAMAIIINNQSVLA